MADTDTKTPLLQSAFRGDTELDLSFCLEVNFIEALDLSAPRLILKFDDSLSILRNVQRILIGDVITCKLADLMHENQLTFSASFTIMSMPVVGEIVTLNCLQTEIANTKIPAVKPQLFPQQGNSVLGILQALAPGFTSYEILEDFSLLNAYHLLPGDRPSRLLRQMAIEHGAVIYALRGKLCFRKLSVLYSSTTDVTFEYKNPQAEHQIVDYCHINKDKLIKDRVERKFSGFSFTDGFLASTKYSSAAPELTSADVHSVMDNRSTIAIPVLDIITWGAGHLAPGLPINLKWNMDVAWDSCLIDESLPTQAVVGTVAHYSVGATNYFCRIKAVVPI